MDDLVDLVVLGVQITRRVLNDIECFVVLGSALIREAVPMILQARGNAKFVIAARQSTGDPWIPVDWWMESKHVEGNHPGGN